MNKIDDDFNEQCANQYVQDHESENRFQGKISNADTEYNNMYEDQTQNHSRDKRIQRVKQEDKEEGSDILEKLFNGVGPVYSQHI